MYTIIRTDTADAGLRNIIYYIAEKFGNDTALEKLSEIETAINGLAENPYLGIEPKYMVLRRQGFRVLVLEKDLILYKVNESDEVIMIYAITDQRQEYMKILKGYI